MSHTNSVIQNSLISKILQNYIDLFRLLSLIIRQHAIQRVHCLYHFITTYAGMPSVLALSGCTTSTLFQRDRKFAAKTISKKFLRSIILLFSFYSSKQKLKYQFSYIKTSFGIPKKAPFWKLARMNQTMRKKAARTNRNAEQSGLPKKKHMEKAPEFLLNDSVTTK